MKKYSKNIPEGSSDIIFENTLYIKKALEAFSRVYEDQNFEEIITPTTEYCDVFDFAGQPIPQEMMYKLTDSSGRLLVLRPDNTTPVARVVATKLSDRHEFLKIFYNQTVFRTSGAYSGKKSETLQSGVEFIGPGGIKADICCIETAIKILKSTGLNFKLEIGHVGFYKSIISEMELSDEKKETVRRYIESKNTGEINNIDKKYYDIIGQIPQLFGGYEVIDKARKLSGENQSAKEVLDYLYRLYTILDTAGHGEHIIIDLGIVHEIDYYTGLVLGGYLEGVGESVLAGGRYDNLIANFGFDLPAIGFAANVNLIAKALENSQKLKESPPAEILHFEPENFPAAQSYIDEKKTKEPNIKIELSCFESLEETIKYAKKHGIKKVVEI